MDLPIENAIAFYPRACKVRGVTVMPLTIGGAVALDALGVDPFKPVDDRHCVLAAFVLCGHERDALAGETRAFKAFFNAVKRDLTGLCNAVNEILNDACRTFLKPQSAGSGSQIPSGCGWAIETAEWLCAEYGWSIDRARDTPVATAFALLAVARQRNKGKHGGPDYVQRKYLYG